MSRPFKNYIKKSLANPVEGGFILSINGTHLKRLEPKMRRRNYRRRWQGGEALLSPLRTPTRSPQLPLGLGGQIAQPPEPIPTVMPELDMSGQNDPVAYSKTFEVTP